MTLRERIAQWREAGRNFRAKEEDRDWADALCGCAEQLAADTRALLDGLKRLKTRKLPPNGAPYAVNDEQPETFVKLADVRRLITGNEAKETS